MMKLLQYHWVYHLAAISNIPLDKRRKFFIHWPLRLCLTNSESDQPNQFHLPSFKFYFFCSVYFDSIVTCLSRKEWKVLENKVASHWQMVNRNCIFEQLNKNANHNCSHTILLCFHFIDCFYVEMYIQIMQMGVVFWKCNFCTTYSIVY